MIGRQPEDAAPRERTLEKAVRLALAAASLAVGLFTAAVFAQGESPPNDDPLPTRAGAHRVLTPPRIDGSLDDWNLSLLAHEQLAIRSERQVNRYPRLPLGSRWQGPDDLSATLFVAYDARSLYIAGRVKDDVPLHRNNITWWLGDAIEIFLDVDLADRAPDRGAPSPYDDDDYQIFLMPLNPEATWGVFKPKPGESAFTGVQVAGARRPDGWDFEAAFPWHNFPRVAPAPGTEIGFNVALDDLDVETESETETYMVWNGQLGPSETPDRFGTLVLLPPSQPAAGAETPGVDREEPVLDLLVIVILISGLVASPFAANVLLRRVSRHPMRKKAAAFAVVAALFAVTLALPPLLRAGLDRSKRNAFASRLEPIAEILAEVRSSELLDPSSDSFRDDLERLLRGDEVPYQESFSFRTVPLGPPPRILWTEQGIPFEDADRGVLVSEPGRNSFLLADNEEGGEVAESAYVVYSVEPREGFKSPPQAEKPQREHRIGTFRLVFANQQSVSVPLETDVNADYGIQARTYTHPSTWSPKAPIARMKALETPPWPAAPGGSDARRFIEHSHQLALDVPPELAFVPIVALEYAHESARDAVRILGIATSNARRNPQLEPVPFRRPSSSGVPIRIFHDSPKSAAIVPEKGNERGTVVPIGASADRIFFVYSATNTYPVAPGAAKFDTIGSIVVTTRGEKEAQHEIPLVAGENVDDSRALADGRHPPGMKSRVAQTWADADGTLLHQDILEYTPVHPGEIAQIAIRDQGGVSSVRLEAVTLGSINPGRRKALSDLKTVAPLEPGRAALAAESRAAIRGLELSVVREKLLAESPSPAIRWDGSREGRILTAFLPVDPDKAPDTFLEVTDRSAGPPPTDAPFTAAKIVLLAILLPLGLVLVTDVLDRSPRLRVKLVVTFGLVSVLPLVVFFFALSRTVGRHVEESLEVKLESHRADAQLAIELARRSAQSDAEALLADAKLAELLSAPGEPVAIEARLSELKRERLADQPSAWVLLRDHAKSAGSSRFAETVYRSEPPPRGYSGLGAASAARRSDVVAAAGGVFVVGVASTEGRVASRFQQLVVAMPLDDQSLRTFQRTVKGAELTLLTPRGESLATTLTPPPPATARRIREDGEAIRQSLSSGTPAPRVAEHPSGEYLVAYDRIRDADGRTVAAISVAVPRADLLALEDQLRRWFAILGSVVFLLVIVVGSLMTAKITVPIERLGRVTAEISRGNLQCEVPVGGADEVGDLTRAFGTMTTDLRGRIQQLHELNRGIQALNETLDPAAIVSAAADALQRASGADGVVLVRRDPGRESLQVLGGIDRGAAIRPFSLPAGGGVASVALAGAESLSLAGLRQDERFRKAHPDEQRLLKPYASLLALPLVAGGETRGAALLLFREGAAEAPGRSREFLGTLASQVTIALENARLYQLAVRDPLSGLHEHSYFTGRLKEEIDRAQRSKSPLSVIRLDVDGLAPFRDQAGPDATAEVLRDVARTIRSAIRRMCVAARTREASFEILLPETEKREALRVAERLRRQVDARLRSDDRPRGGPRDAKAPSCAAGAVAFPDDGTSLEFLLNAAEIALEKSRAALLAAPAPERDESSGPRKRPPRPADAGRRSDKTLAMLETAERIAQSAVTVLIQGETGVGKEVLAEKIHRWSPRRDRPLVKVNCSAFPETLLESELFGHEKGAFTGADQRKTGRFEQADGGTLFLDEIGELSPAIQVKLLRVIQDRTFERLGSSSPVTVDVRIIAATNRNLVRAIQTGAFREDLYYRLNVAPIVVPPLRDRKEEIPGLVDEFIRQWNEAASSEPGAKKFEGIAPEALDILFHHSWPGNVRELKNAIERAMVVSSGKEIRPGDLEIGEAASFSGADHASRVESAAATFGSGTPAPRASASREAPSDSPTSAHREVTVGESLNSRQLELLRLLETRNGITTAEYVTLLQVSERTGLRDLTDLVRRRILSRVGRTKGAVYRLAQPQRRA